MPEDKFYKITAFEYQKRGDFKEEYRHQMPTEVMFEFSYDNGTTWHQHQNGQWTKVLGERRRLYSNYYPTGNERAAVKKEFIDEVHVVEVDPPMFGNAFSFNLGYEGKGSASSGRFDLRAQKLENFDPRIPQLAMLDLGGTFDVLGYDGD